MAISFSDKFKMLSVSSYDGNNDSLEHLENFKVGWNFMLAQMSFDVKPSNLL